MTTVTVGQKGQIVVPINLRRHYGIHPGSRLMIEEKEDSIVLRTMNRDYFASLSGVLKGSGVLKALEETRREDREKENRSR